MRKVVPWLAALVPLVLLVAWFWNRGPGLDADDWALTLMHAQALVDGRPYDDTGYIPTAFDPSPAVQPPGLPLLLAITMLVTGGFHQSVVKVVMAITSIPLFLFAGLYFARTHGRAIGLAVTVMLIVGLAATGPIGATHVQTDLGFAGLVWATLFLLDASVTITWPRVLAVFLLASMAMVYRFVCVALVPTIALFAATHRHQKGARLTAPLVVWSAGGITALFLVGWGPVASQLSLSVLVVAKRVIPTIRRYGASAAAAHLYPLPGDVPNDIFHVVSLSLAVLGVVAWTRRHWRSSAWWFTVSYSLLLLVVSARNGRYLIPLFPVLVFGFIDGLRLALSAVGREWQEARARTAAVATAAVVALSSLVILLIQEPRTGGYLADLPETQGLFDYLEAEGAQATTRVAFMQPRVLAWTTGIPSMVLPAARPDEMMPELERGRITHVVIDRIGLQPTRTARMLRAIAAYSCRFEADFQNDSFTVYRLVPACPSRPPARTEA